MSEYRIFENKYTGKCRIKHAEGYVCYTDLNSLDVGLNDLASHITREWDNRSAAQAWIREMEAHEEADVWEEVPVNG